MTKEFNRNLVFDIGMHNGQDTGFYLSQGYNVVAVEANAILCKKNEVKFREYIKTGQLIIINKAIGETTNAKVTFYISEHSSWSSMIKEKAKRNNKFVSEVVVSTITLHSLIQQYGVPYYCKIDIEGYEMKAINGLKNSLKTYRPRLLVEYDRDYWKKCDSSWEEFFNLMTECMDKL